MLPNTNTLSDTALDQTSVEVLFVFACISHWTLKGGSVTRREVKSEVWKEWVVENGKEVVWKMSRITGQQGPKWGWRIQIYKTCVEIPLVSWNWWITESQIRVLLGSCNETMQEASKTGKTESEMMECGFYAKILEGRAKNKGSEFFHLPSSKTQKNPKTDYATGYQWASLCWESTLAG